MGGLVICLRRPPPRTCGRLDDGVLLGDATREGPGAVPAPAFPYRRCRGGVGGRAVHVGSADRLRIWDSSCARSSSCRSFRRLAMLRWYGMRAWSEMMVGGMATGNGRGETPVSGLVAAFSTSVTRFRGADRRGVLVRFVPGRRSDELGVVWVACRSSVESWRVKLVADSGNKGSSKHPKSGLLSFPTGSCPKQLALRHEGVLLEAGVGEWKLSLLRRKGSSAGKRKYCPRFSKLILEKTASSSSPPFSLIEKALLPVELLREELELLPLDLRRGDPAAETLARLPLGVRCSLDRWAFGAESEGTVSVGLRLADIVDGLR